MTKITAMAEKHFYNTVPFLPVANLKETLQFYKDRLGFSGEWIDEPRGIVGGIRRDELSMLFQQHPVYLNMINVETESFELLFFVSNIAEIYEEYKGKGVEMVNELVVRPWGVTEFIVKDLNGYWLRITEGKHKAK